MYGCESWTLKKAEHQRMDAFELWSWRRLLRVSWTARRSNQSILKEISPEYSLEGLMLKLKLQYFGHLMHRLTHWKRPWCWERWKAGGEGDDRGWDGWMAPLTQMDVSWAGFRSWWWTGKPGMLQSMGSQRVRHNWVTEPMISQGWHITVWGQITCSLFLWIKFYWNTTPSICLHIEAGNLYVTTELTRPTGKQRAYGLWGLKSLFYDLLQKKTCADFWPKGHNLISFPKAHQALCDQAPPPPQALSLAPLSPLLQDTVTLLLSKPQHGLRAFAPALPSTWNAHWPNRHRTHSFLLLRSDENVISSEWPFLFFFKISLKAFIEFVTIFILFYVLDF